MSNDIEREAFENWAKSYDMRPLSDYEIDDEGYYEEGDVQRLWSAWQAARAQCEPSSGVPVGFIPSSGLNNLASGHPAKIYPMDAMPSPLESHTLLYTHPHTNQPDSGAGSDGCQWVEDEGIWESACGYALWYEDGTPSECGQAFCPKCGKPCLEVPQTPQQGVAE